MDALIVVVADRDVGSISMLLSDETGLPIIRGPGPGVIPVVNARDGEAVIKWLEVGGSGRAIAVMGRSAWEELRGRIPPMDLARVLMRVGLRELRSGKQ
ncbi:hypothetical protein GCM10007981_04190 [Thermocladium modestius]|uniref:Uncharacterized protein n=1 Tax=Thermocladium modestius TaxID=62609 RepID=A0A830GUA1_9CREN|nr:hypothetical protein [Thermocladium modestius]GGP19651.1 hypothetical protein GCM10007981_04190 [Thermocladium modestius]